MAVVTKEELENAQQDTAALALIVNGAADEGGDGLVTTRTGGDVPTIRKLIEDAEAQIDELEQDADAAAATATAQAAIATAAAALITPGPAPAEIAFGDKFNRIAAYFDADGAFRSAHVRASQINDVPARDFKRRLNRQPLPAPADNLGFIIFGQSKGLGNGASVSTFAADIPSSLMFNANGVVGAGPRAQEGLGTVAQNHGALIAMAEKLNGVTGNGETGLGQSARMLDYLLRTENGVSLAQLGVQLIHSAPGEVNTDIDTLDKPSAYYTRVMDDVTYGASLSAADNKSYAVPAVFWAQGEYDIQFAGTTRATYKAKLKQLRLDLDADIKVITGQSEDVALIIYSTTMSVQANTDIALAQMDAAAEDPLIIISHPDYCNPNSAPGNTHHDVAGYAGQGSFFARAFKRHVFDGDASGVALYQSGTIQRTGKILSVPFWVPIAPLLLSNRYFATQANSGFKALKVGGAENVITGVTALHDRVRIVLTSAEAGTLYYTHGAVWGGNLHDSDDLDMQSFLRRPLANCALPFEKAFL